jgi:hypothetical protein
MPKLQKLVLWYLVKQSLRKHHVQTRRFFLFCGSCSAGSDVKSTGIVSTEVQDFYACNTLSREAPVTYHRDNKGIFLICNFVIDGPVIFGSEVV